MDAVVHPEHADSAGCAGVDVVADGHFGRQYRQGRHLPMTDVDTRPWHQRAGRSRCMVDASCINPVTRHLLFDYHEDGERKVGHLWRCEAHWQDYVRAFGGKIDPLYPDPDYLWPDAAGRN